MWSNIKWNWKIFSGVRAGGTTFLKQWIEFLPLRAVEAIHFGTRGPDFVQSRPRVRILHIHLRTSWATGKGRWSNTSILLLRSPSCFLEMHPLWALPSVDAVVRLNPNWKRWKVVSRKVCLVTNLCIDLFGHVTVHEQLHNHVVKYWRFWRFLRSMLGRNDIFKQWIEFVGRRLIKRRKLGSSDDPKQQNRQRTLNSVLFLILASCISFQLWPWRYQRALSVHLIVTWRLRGWTLVAMRHTLSRKLLLDSTNIYRVLGI